MVAMKRDSCRGSSVRLPCLATLRQTCEQHRAGVTHSSVKGWGFHVKPSNGAFGSLTTDGRAGSGPAWNADVHPRQTDEKFELLMTEAKQRRDC